MLVPKWSLSHDLSCKDCDKCCSDPFTRRTELLQSQMMKGG